MAKHIEIGTHGEALAALWLQKKGYEIKHQNWRHRHLEIDIIALRGNTLHFIEVKTRTSSIFGGPELSVKWKKVKRIKQAAFHYLQANRGFCWIQFDIVAITLHKNQSPMIELFSDF
jgi:putative endonuclease